MGAGPAAYAHNTFVALVMALVSPSKAIEIEAEGKRVSYWMLLSSLMYALVPFDRRRLLYTVSWWQADPSSR